MGRYAFRVYEEFAALVTRYREAAGMTQADLARAINVNPSTISRVESLENIPKLDTVLALAKALKIDLIEDLMASVPQKKKRASRR